MKPVRLPRLWCLRLGVIGTALVGGKGKTIRPSAGSREPHGGRSEAPSASDGESAIADDEVGAGVGQWRELGRAPRRASDDADIPVEVGGG